MEQRLALQFALLTAAVLFGRAIWDGSTVADTLETVLLGGTLGWLVGGGVALVLNPVVAEYVARLAGQTAEVADAEPISADRISER